MKISIYKHFNIIYISIAIVSLWAICDCICLEHPAYADGAFLEEPRIKKEELKLEMKPFMGKNVIKQNIPVVKNQAPQPLPAPRIERPPAPKEEEKASINIHEAAAREVNLPTKKVFKPEVGLVNMVTMPAGYSGVLKLKDCIDIAVKNHIPLRIAEKNIALSKMRLWESRRNLIGTVTVTFEEYGGEIYGRKYYGRKQYIEGQQPLFHGGELYFTMKQAELNQQVVTNDYNRVKNELVLQVKKAYYSLSKTRENLKIQKVLSEEVAKTYDMITKQEAANVTSKLEVLNVTSQTSQVKYQLVSAEGDDAMAELILKQAMDLNTDSRIDIVPVGDFKKVTVDYETALRVAFLTRPEIRINALMVDYYNYGRGIARSKGSLKVDLVGQWGLAKENYLAIDSGMLPDGTYDMPRKLSQMWYGGVKASMPFWGSTAEYSFTREQWTPVVSAYQGTEALTNSYKFKLLDKLDYYSDKQLAEIDFDKQRQELVKIKHDVTLEVKEGCFNYQKAVIQLETASSKVKYQEKDLELVKLKRGMDEAQDSNVIESMIKLAQEKFGYLQAVADCYTSLASINKAVGLEDYYKTEE